MAGWHWEARNKAGKPITGWTEGGGIRTPDDLIAHLKVHYHNNDYADFRCELRDKPPSLMRPVPPDWFQFGTKRMVAEVLAGIRPAGYAGLLEDLPDYKPSPLQRKPLWVRRG